LILLLILFLRTVARFVGYLKARKKEF